MCAEKNDSVIKETLENLCCSNGWSYGILWGFDQRNSLLLTLKDAYCEEQMVALIDNMLLQVHVVGGGVIGQTAFIKKHRWMFADANPGNQNSLGSFESIDFFQDESEFYCQFSMGIKTSALISVEPWGVVQLGSTHMIPERMDFVDQVKQVFRDMAQSLRTELSENQPSSSVSRSFETSEQFSSLSSFDMPHSVNMDFYNETGSEDLLEAYHSSGIPSQLLDSTVDHQCTDSLFTPLFIENQFLFGESNLFEFSDIPTLNNKNDGSVLTKSWPHSTSGQSENILSKDMSNISNLPLPDPSVFKAQTRSSLLSLDELFHKNGPSKNCLMDDDLCQLFAPSNTSSSTSLLDNGSLHVPGLIPISDLNIAKNLPTNSMQSSVTNAFVFDHHENKCSDASSIDKMIFSGSGTKREYHKDQDLDETLISVVSGSDSCFSGKMISTEGNNTGTISKSLFSKLGLDQLLEGFTAASSNSLHKSRFEDQSSKRRKIDSFSWSPCQAKAQVLSSFDRGTQLMGNETNDVTELDIEASMKNSGSRIVGNTSKLPQESVKVGKKKAKPGTKPRPKDRQMIQDRLAELRHLIPNGEKMSIDRLLERTIRHMNFMQSLTKHAESLKKIDKPKHGASAPKKDFSNTEAGVTWACEIGDQNMVCPLIVEDLTTQGKMLIEMLCEEQGFFLEIVDIIRGFGLVILKGVMEIRDAKIWAHFIVEAEGNRRVTRHEIFSSLIQLLQMTGQAALNSSHHFLGKVISSGTSLFDNCQLALPIPANTVDTLQCANS